MVQAAIDLGTVTSRLMVADVEHGLVDVLRRSIVITDLGEGLAQSNLISDAAYSRLLGALMQFQEEITDVKTELIIDGRGSIDIPVTIVATSAMRDAANAPEILSQLSDFGFNVEVISGKREAELSFKGTLSGFSGLKEPVMSVDVGGGSTELIVGDSAAHIDASHSFDIGSRRVTEMFLKHDPPTQAEINQAQSWIEAHITSFFESLDAQPTEILAVAGTATSAITVRDKVTHYDSSLVHGKHISTDELLGITQILASMNLEKRRQVDGLEPGRAPVIIGGLIALLSVLDVFGKNELIVSDTDILEGIILDSSAIC